ncbi:MAG: nitrate/nitrite transporter NrtS [Bacteroidetes bacterium]|nr:nitrate/nitrite transporter NrtS [Bacteroidota bacterium]
MQKKNYFTAIKIALFVGTILNLINSYDLIFQNNWSAKLVLKILFTYSVPFFVSLFSSYKALRNKI